MSVLRKLRVDRQRQRYSDGARMTEALAGQRREGEVDERLK